MSSHVVQIKVMWLFPLLHHSLALPVAQAAGVIMLAEQAHGPGIALPSPADKVCFMYLTDDSSEQPASSRLNGSTSLDKPTSQLNLNGSASTAQQPCSLLVFCQVALQPERATSWMQGLLQVVQAQHVLAIASLPVSTYPCACDRSTQCCTALLHGAKSDHSVAPPCHAMHHALNAKDCHA